MGPASQATISVRPFRREDSEHVRKLFVEAITTGRAFSLEFCTDLSIDRFLGHAANSPREFALRSHLSRPGSFVAYTLFTLGGMVAYRRMHWAGYGALLSCVIFTAFLAYRWALSRSFHDYCATSLQAQDLLDIAAYYAVEGNNIAERKSMFWVVEAIEPSGLSHGVVGCGGLGVNLHAISLHAERRT